MGYFLDKRNQPQSQPAEATVNTAPTSSPQEGYFLKKRRGEQVELPPAAPQSPMQTEGLPRTLARTGRNAAVGITSLFGDIPIMALGAADRLNPMNLLLPKNERLDAEKRKLFGTLPSQHVMNFIDRNTDNTLQPRNDEEAVGDTIVQIASAIPQLAGLPSKLGKSAANKVSDMFTEKVLPKELASGEALLDARGNTLFSKSPNKTASGLEAIEAINREYHLGKTATREAYDLTKAEGNFPVLGSGIENELDRVTTHLADKVAIGSKEQVALGKLNKIREKIASGDSLTANEILDIKQTINSNISKNKFGTSGDAVLINFKDVVQKGLDKAGTINPKFAENLTEAELRNSSLNAKFKDNKALSKFWSPKDYTQWVRSKNAAEKGIDISPITDETVGRASQFLDNMNTADAGKIQAALNALPPIQRRKIARDAYVLAKKEKISLPNAIRQLLTLNPRGFGTAGKAFITKSAENAPLENYIKDLKGLRIPKPTSKPIAIEEPTVVKNEQKLLMAPDEQKLLMAPDKKPLALPYYKEGAEILGDKSGNLRASTSSEDTRNIIARVNEEKMGLREVRASQYKNLQNELLSKFGQSEIGRAMAKNPYDSLMGQSAIKDIVYKEFDKNAVNSILKNRMINMLKRAQSSRLTPLQRKAQFRELKTMAKEQKLNMWKQVLSDIENNPNASILGKTIVKELKGK
jgi:hypothetical protein